MRVAFKGTIYEVVKVCMRHGKKEDRHFTYLGEEDNFGDGEYWLEMYLDPALAKYQPPNNQFSAILVDGSYQYIDSVYNKLMTDGYCDFNKVNGMITKPILTDIRLDKSRGEAVY